MKSFSARALCERVSLYMYIATGKKNGEKCRCVCVHIHTAGITVIRREENEECENIRIFYCRLRFSLEPQLRGESNTLVMSFSFGGSVRVCVEFL